MTHTFFSLVKPVFAHNRIFCTSLKFMVLGVVFALTSQVQGQVVVINEVMSDNSHGVTDEDGDHSDWIELFNPSQTTVGLEGKWLSDDPDDLQKWPIPAAELEPGQFLTVFASGKDRHDGELHTNFGINSRGETVLLSDDDGTTLDVVAVLEVRENASFGRLPDGGDWRSLDNASFAASNHENDVIVCSHNSGFYDESIALVLESFMGDDVHYTLDGTIPSMESPIFTDAMVLSNPDEHPNVFSNIRTNPESNWRYHPEWRAPQSPVDKAHVIRFRSFRGGVPTTSVFTRTFFVDEDIHEKYTVPVVSLVANPQDLFSDSLGIYVPGDLYDDESEDWTTNYLQRGRAWEREVHVAFFDQEGQLNLTQNAGVRIHGSASRSLPQKSLRLYARGEYGPRHFDHALLPNKPHDSYKRMLLSAPIWPDAFLKDFMALEVVRGMDFECQGGQEVVLFINGEYWGVHYLRERIDEHFVAAEHGMAADSVVVFSPQSWENPIPEYWAFIEMLDGMDMESASSYEWVKRVIDIDSYLEYMVAQLFMANYDWPANNQKIWKPTHQDGLMRWILYDLSWAFEGVEYNMFEHATETENMGWPNFPETTFLFRKLMEHDTFRGDFQSAFTSKLQGQFNRATTLGKAEKLKGRVAPEINRHAARWGFPQDSATWSRDVDAAIHEFLNDRPCVIETQLAEFLEVPAVEFSCEGDLDELDFDLGPNPNTGTFAIFNRGDETILGTVELYNGKGQLVYERGSVFVYPGLRKEISLGVLPPGVYVLLLKTTDFQKAFKVAIVNN